MPNGTVALTCRQTACGVRTGTASLSCPGGAVLRRLMSASWSGAVDVACSDTADAACLSPSGQELVGSTASECGIDDDNDALMFASSATPYRPERMRSIFITADSWSRS